MNVFNFFLFLFINPSLDPKQIWVVDLLPEQCALLDGL